MRVADYRLKTPLKRGRLLSLAAALTAAGVATDCGFATPLYGASLPDPAGRSGASGASGLNGASGHAWGAGGGRNGGEGGDGGGGGG
jgi:hypothetical protein